MAKYIDAEKLRKEIERRIDILADVSIKCAKNDDMEMHNYYHEKAISLEELLSFIGSLQQEQPNFTEPDKEEQSQIDWESEIEEYWIASGWSKSISLGKFKVIARYFIGLALNAKKEE